MGCRLTRFITFLHSFLTFLHSSLHGTVLFFTTLKFAFRDSFISYVYKHVCESTNRVVSIKNAFDTELLLLLFCVCFALSFVKLA